MSKDAIFVSEKLPVTPVKYRLAQDYFYAGHHPINPVLQSCGLIEYERGAAAVGITPHGEMVLLSTTDIDDISLEHRFIKDGQFFTRIEKDLPPSQKDRTVGQDILKDGSVYLGQFVEPQTFSNGDNNYNHILGVAAWKPTPKQLVNSLLHQFSAYHRQDLLDSGILMHHNDLTWTSREMVFAARPMMQHGFLNRKKPVTNEHGEQLYTLSTLTAPGKGLDAAKLYHQNFSTSGHRRWPSIVRGLMRSAVNNISDHEEGMTIEDVQARVVERFSPTAKLLRQGGSTYTSVITQDGPEKLKGAPWAKGKLNQVFAGAVFGLNDISKTDLAVGVGLPAAIAVGGLLTEHEELGVAAMTVPATILLARFGLLWISRTRHHFDSSMFDDLVPHFWPEDTKPKNIPHQFEMIHPKVLENLRILPREELDVLSRLPSNHTGTAPAWDMLYILGMQNGPYGSQASFHKVGEQSVVLVREDEKSSGMKIEYWPLLNVAFARHAVSDHLPQTLLDTFKSAQDPIRMIEALRDDAGDIAEYRSRFIAQEEYDSRVKDMAALPSRNMYRHDECTAQYLTGYPLDEIPEGREHGEESEWVSDSKAATAAEVAAELAKAFFKGPHV